MKLSRIVPKYGYIPFILVIAVNCFVFYFTRFLTAGAYHYDVSIWLDAKIPFVPEFIMVYILAIGQWVLVLALAAREGKDFYYKATAAEMSSKVFVFLVFLLLPTSMERGEIQGNDLFDMLTRLIYTLDAPNNLFPSIHCLDSWVCLRVVCKMKTAPKWFQIANAVFSVLVFASVVLVKQHLFVDILGGILIGELGFLMVRLFHTDKLLSKIIPAKLQ